MPEGVWVEGPENWFELQDLQKDRHIHGQDWTGDPLDVGQPPAVLVTPREPKYRLQQSNKNVYLKNNIQNEGFFVSYEAKGNSRFVVHSPPQKKNLKKNLKTMVSKGTWHKTSTQNLRGFLVFLSTHHPYFFGNPVLALRDHALRDHNACSSFCLKNSEI